MDGNSMEDRSEVFFSSFSFKNYWKCLYYPLRTYGTRKFNYGQKTTQGHKIYRTLLLAGLPTSSFVVPERRGSVEFRYIPLTAHQQHVLSSCCSLMTGREEYDFLTRLQRTLFPENHWLIGRGRHGARVKVHCNTVQ